MRRWWCGSPAPAGMVPPAYSAACATTRFPRTRGDGPRATAAISTRSAVPPHPRGWSRPPPIPAARTPGSPAPAGMVPRAQSKGASGPGFPRTRGDGPNGEVDASSAPAVPPHPRGWSRMAGLLPVPPGGSPAPAGMVPSSRPPLCRMRRFPRTRGDGPWYSVQSDVPPMVPPHPRGWSLRAANLPVGTHGSPAPAGMVPSRNKPQSPPARFPRTRGDGPFVQAVQHQLFKVPPHPRGWSLAGEGCPEIIGGSPAPAGMVPISIPALPALPWFPRTRGDGPDSQVVGFGGSGVPPHPRGWSRHGRARRGPYPGSPAPAGMVRSLVVLSGGGGRFPRTRGDGPTS